jgi:hypothetical protein
MITLTNTTDDFEVEINPTLNNIFITFKELGYTLLLSDFNTKTFTDFLCSQESTISFIHDRENSDTCPVKNSPPEFRLTKETLEIDIYRYNNLLDTLVYKRDEELMKRLINIYTQINKFQIMNDLNLTEEEYDRKFPSYWEGNSVEYITPEIISYSYKIHVRNWNYLNISSPPFGI